MENDQRDNNKPTLLGIAVFLGICGSTQYLSDHLSNCLYLINHYGWMRFNEESLKFIQMSKGAPWLVSNGDHLEPGFGHFLLGTIIWLPMCLSLLWMADKLLGRQRLFHEEDPEK